MTIVDFYGGGASTQKNANKRFYDDFDKNILLYFGPEVVKNLSEIVPAQRTVPTVDKILDWTKNWVKSKVRPNSPKTYEVERQQE